MFGTLAKLFKSTPKKPAMRELGARIASTLDAVYMTHPQMLENPNIALVMRKDYSVGLSGRLSNNDKDVIASVRLADLNTFEMYCSTKEANGFGVPFADHMMTDALASDVVKEMEKQLSTKF